MIQRIIFFCLLICISIPAFSASKEEAEIYYSRGNERLKEGMNELEKLKQLINIGFSIKSITVGNIRKTFKEDRGNLSLLLDEIKKYKSHSYSEHTCRNKIGKVFEEAIKEFEKAIRQDNTFVDAYLGEAAAYVEMGNYEKALPIFTLAKKLMEKEKKIEKIRFINPFEDTMKDLFYGMADEIMKKRLPLSGSDNKDKIAKEIIEIFMSWREEWTKKEIEKIEQQIKKKEYTEEEKEKLEINKEGLILRRVNNFFEAVNFYHRHHKKDEAGKEYSKAEKQMVKEGFGTESYSGAIDGAKIFETLKDVSCKVDDMELVKEFKSPVKVRFFRDNDTITSDYLYLSFLSSGCWVEFKDEISCEITGESQSFYMDKDPVACEIIFPELEIKKENKLPFYVLVDDNMPTHLSAEKKDLDGYTSMELNFKKGKKDKIQKATNSSTISSAGNGVSGGKSSFFEPCRKYPIVNEEYQLKIDNFEQWTILERIIIKEKERKAKAEFKVGDKFSAKIIISPFGGKELKICKATWPPAKDKIMTRWISGILFLSPLLLR